jgi:hypothetical protein
MVIRAGLNSYLQEVGFLLTDLCRRISAVTGLFSSHTPPFLDNRTRTPLDQTISLFRVQSFPSAIWMDMDALAMPVIVPSRVLGLCTGVVANGCSRIHVPRGVVTSKLTKRRRNGNGKGASEDRSRGRLIATFDLRLRKGDTFSYQREDRLELSGIMPPDSQMTCQLETKRRIQKAA